MVERASKGKATEEEVRAKAAEISKYEPIKPLRLFVDDVTSEKLTSVLAENKGCAAVVSAEGGIFDIISGLYSRNVNIDVFLKGHSGDTIRVDRIGRASESIIHPALTMVLAVQPEVLNGLMSNNTFRGRGLTARFLYSMPMLSILASYAQEESLSASENQKWRVKRNFEEGIPWRFFMLGYRRENGKLAIVPEEAEIVRSIFDDYLAGKGVTAIAKRLNESGYATQSGCVFHKSAVERILRNYAYTGNLLLQTKFRENHLTKVTRKNQGELPRYHAADTHEAIIHRKHSMRSKRRSCAESGSMRRPSRSNHPPLQDLSLAPYATSTTAAKPPPRDRSGSAPPTIPTANPTAPPKPSRRKS